MAYAIHEQYLDRRSGFHVIELRDEAKRQHFVQIKLSPGMLARHAGMSPRRTTLAKSTRRPL